MGSDPHSPVGDPVLIAWPDAARTSRFVARLAAGYAAALALLATLFGYALSRLPAAPIALEIRRGGLAGIVLGALLLALTGLVATLALTWARSRQHAGPWMLPAPLARALPPRHRILRASTDTASLVRRMARKPQGSMVPLLAFAAAAVAWALRPAGVSAAATAAAGMASASAYVLGGSLFGLAFPLLIAERFVAGVPRTVLPEASGLQALLYVPVLVLPAAGTLEFAAGLGVPWVRTLQAGLSLFLVLVATELGLRALARWFLPPPPAEAARAAVDSVVARLLRPSSIAPEGLAPAIKTHLGIDFARSWALGYLRAAFVPVVALMLLFGWGLTGVALIDLDQRGVYERFGAPVAVLTPGLRIVLPWPLGQIRRIEYGVVHTVPLGDAASTVAYETIAAEAAPPASADRLWNSSHPGEATFLIASESTGDRQSFQAVSADLRVLYRVGLNDAAALRAAYSQADPATLVGAEAGRLVANFFAGRTLAAVLGENRETMADELRAALQRELDGLGSGLEVVGVVIEAIHPPTGAAEAYHNVQAAQITAEASIAIERGRAVASANLAGQQSTATLDRARGAAAESVGAAEVALRQFTADQMAAATGGQAFLLERYLGTLSMALSKSALVIVDHRLGGGDAPVIDLRPLAGRAAGPTDPD
jgi:regulator of protease activity HflC (stomatin/prohibitin superfamily)